MVVAPDSFKGSLEATAVAAAISAGWLAIRPDDELVQVPLADGGEGTTEVLRRSQPDAVENPLDVCGPDDRPVETRWLLLPDGTAVVELAAASGLPLMAQLAPLRAHTIGLGQLLRAAVGDPRTRRLVVALGGSASTDGGAGALAALGARWLDDAGRELTGGAALVDCARVEVGELLRPPPEGVRLLVDVDSPLLGPRGAATRFAPQKGATPDQVELLERAMARVEAVCSQLSSFAATTPGAGAAGGTAFGLASLWGAQVVAGAPELARLSGLPAALHGADLVLTGEGRLDEQSVDGKVVGHVIDAAARLGIPVVACVGSLAGDPPPELLAVHELTSLAGSRQQACDRASHWLTEAGRRAALARTTTNPHPGGSR